MNIVGRMLACDPERKKDIIVAGAEWPLLVLAGSNDRGEFFGTGFMDTSGFGSGARSYKDGVDTGGPPWNPLMRVPNVEAAEESFPVLYLYRRELKDSGGAGRWRGGVGLEYAVTPYRAGEMESVTNAGGMTISTFGAMGLFGGYPSPSVRFEVVKNSDLNDFYERREMPRDINELTAAKKYKLRAKSNGTSIEAGDVILGMAPGGGGYGDPLEREPWRVVKDVALGYVSAEAARDVYGVVFDERDELNEDATQELRERILAERAGWQSARQILSDTSEPAAPGTPATGEPPGSVHEYVVSRDEGDFRVLACSRCDHVLGDYQSEYKLGLLVDEGSATLIPTTSEPAEFLDEPIVFRRFCCPGCQALMEVEIVRAGEPFIPEMQFT
jgi:N-methylhydantoinase B